MHSRISACTFYYRTVETMAGIKVWGELFVDCAKLNLYFIINDFKMREHPKRASTCFIAYWNSVNDRK